MQALKERRAKDAQDLLNNAKRRLGILHSEVSNTYMSGADGSCRTLSLLRTRQVLQNSRRH